MRGHLQLSGVDGPDLGISYEDSIASQGLSLCHVCCGGAFLFEKGVKRVKIPSYMIYAIGIQNELSSEVTVAWGF